MGCGQSLVYKEISNYVSRSVVNLLIEHSITLQKQLKDNKHKDFITKLQKLLEISIQQNQYFNDQLQRMFDKFNLQLPGQFVSSRFTYSDELKNVKKQFIKQYSQKNRQIGQLDSENIWLKQRCYQLENQLTIKQNQKPLTKTMAQHQLDRLNQIIGDYQKIQQQDKNRIKQLQQGLQSWRHQSIVTDQLYTDLSNRSSIIIKAEKKKSKPSRQDIIKQKQLLEEQIKTLNILLNQKHKKEGEFYSQMQAHRINSQLRQNTQIQYRDQINRLKQQIKNSNNSISTFVANKKVLQEQLQILVTKQNESSYQNYKKTQNQLREKIIDLEQTKVECQIQLNKNIQINGNLRKKIVELINEIENLKKQLKHVNILLQKQKMHQESLIKTQQQQRGKMLQEKKQHLIKAHHTLQAEKQRVIQQLSKKNQYFNGYILNIDTPQDTEWVVNNIEKYLGKEITSTRMIWRMDLQNKNNLHNYIDDTPNIVLIVKMQNGQIILAYSEPAFIQKMGNINYRPGMMLGLRNRKVFTVKKEKTSKQNITDPRPIIWDEQYIIWGKSDLRLRVRKTELYSNYGTPNCSYQERDNNKKGEIRDLFMMEDRITQVVDYEFHQVKFKENQNQ